MNTRSLWLQRPALVFTLLASGAGFVFAPCPTAVAAPGQGHLTGGQKLSAGQFLKSSNGQYRLDMQTDGNLVLYGPKGALWASGTSGAGHSAVMQTDGNFVVYDAASEPLWNSGTWNNPEGKLVLQDDGNLVIYRGHEALWHTNTFVRDTRLDPGEVLAAGESIVSSDDRYRLAMQQDGNLVLYGPQAKAMWSSNTFKAGSKAVMQQDGNLVVYDGGGKPVWSSGTAGRAGAQLVMQTDGNLVMYQGGKAVWHTNTWERPSVLQMGEVIRDGEARWSPNKKYTLVMQKDGNLVLYGPGGAVWATGTQGSGYFAVMQTDGHLVVYDSKGAPKWWSGTAGNPGAQLSVRDDGKAVITLGPKTLWSSSGGKPQGPPTGNVVYAAGPGKCKIQVDQSIKSSVEALLQAAHKAGLTMCGWGWRSSQQQIALRIKNCGGNSHYNIYQKPASQCNPPTAIPGKSMHERGLAIDFQGVSAGSARFNWLKANAAKFGLYNLPSEAWHWSTNGN